MQPRMHVAFTNLVRVRRRFLDREFTGQFRNTCPIGLVITMTAGGEHLQIIKRRPGAIDLQREVRAFLVDDRMLGVHEMFGIQMRDCLVAKKLQGHRVPSARHKVIRAFAVAHGEPRSARVASCL